ncbi:hypothetical protein [Gilvibacter sediminis]|uniref:hypothetical protein n=1 Tax=Gilvibacter sediminis TaxID=379071 RepID=UPI0023505C87|nr:hypothetical protein [Gilvibacter sediminis]MDC7999294.1 hypothetical protein [Gilvibacter sediminis]
MAQDIRDLLQRDANNEKAQLSANHQDKFASLLEERLPEKKKPMFLWLKVAAIGILLLGIGYVLMTNTTAEPQEQMAVEETVPADNQDNQETTKGLSDFSPEFKKLEDYYTRSITMGIASLEVNPENQELIDGYMRRLSTLDKEYKRLNAELVNVGPNDLTVNALIDNLKLRLELLLKLKNKLRELKSANNENNNQV